MRTLALRSLLSSLVLGACATPRDDGADSAAASRATPSAESGRFAAFVDDYLAHFASFHPSIAAGNGLHAFDDRLEDFRRASIDAELASLERDRARLAAIDTAALTPDERVDARIIAGLIDAWVLDLATVRNWTRNPMIYAAAISDGVHDLMTKESDTPEARLRRIASKLRGVPVLLDAARQNIRNPPRVFAARGASMLRGIPGMLDDDMPLAFAGVADRALWTELRAVSDTAKRAIADYATYLERDVVPGADGSFVVGAENLAARYRAEDMIDIPLDRMLAIGERELAKVQSEFRAAAAQVDSTRPPMAVWADVLQNHPARGTLVEAARKAVDELIAFGTAKRLVDLPSPERPVVAAAPPFDIGFASMHSSPPLESRPVKSFYYITDAQPAWTPARQDAWLQRFNYATLAIVSAHEVYPGHWAHSLYMRRTPGKVRRIWIGLNPFPQPSSGQDGWAHYAEQLIVDEGFHADDPRYRMAQLSEALTRICRLVVGIGLHARGWTVDQAADYFEKNAYLPSPAARAEAERGTYDPTYGVYFLGKLGARKLRRDVQAREGDRFDLRRFHERVMTNGIAPWAVHRALMLPGDTSDVID